MCVVQVTFLGVSKKFTICQEAKQINTKQNLHFECLEPHHFVPEIVETYPYEQLSHAVLNWVEENADRCDVIHGHEWGGAFVDLITANNHRQVRSPRHASLLICCAKIPAGEKAHCHAATHVHGGISYGWKHHQTSNQIVATHNLSGSRIARAVPQHQPPVLRRCRTAWQSLSGSPVINFRLLRCRSRRGCGWRCSRMAGTFGHPWGRCSGPWTLSRSALTTRCTLRMHA